MVVRHLRPIHQVAAGDGLRSVEQRFLSYTFSSCLHDPPYLAVLKRPCFVRAACHPPQRLLGQAALSYNDPATTGPLVKVSHLYSINKRLTAHAWVPSWTFQFLPALLLCKKDAVLSGTLTGLAVPIAVSNMATRATHHRVINWSPPPTETACGEVAGFLALFWPETNR